MKFSQIIAVALFAGASAYAATFPQCPPGGNDTSGCELLITVTAASGGAATAFTVATASPDQGPYDGADDTLVGILNSSGSALTSIALSSSTDIFGFDGDGFCDGNYGVCNGHDSTGYAPGNVSFSNINGAGTSGTVNFNPGLADGGSTFFSLEEALTASQITSPAPEPSSILLMGLGLIGGVSILRKRRASK